MQPSRADFCHPYEPYPIQLQFMESLYQCLEHGRVGIFESPTGTGKSLSLICGSLTWLRDHRRRVVEETTGGALDDADDPPWMREAAAAERRRTLLQNRLELESQLAAIRAKEEKSRQRQHGVSHPRKRKKLEDGSAANVEDPLEDFVLEDYESDQEQQRLRNTGMDAQSGLSSATASLLTKLQTSVPKPEDERPSVETRVFYCSRTHSQLSQFVNELRRVKLPSSIDIGTDGKEVENEVTETLKHISLGSRKNLCINTKVSSLGSAVLVNERCREMQKPGQAEDHKCKYLPPKDDNSRWANFRDHAISKIRDIEDLARLGSEIEVCPYYGSRSAILSSEIVTLPYPLLLQKSARETLKLVLKDQVVIIDEAHNLMDAIASTNSAEVTLEQLDRSISQLTAYVQKFKLKLKGKNRVYVAQILRLLHSITACARGKMESFKRGEHIISPLELMAGKGVDQINPHKLSIYLQESKLALKVAGYAREKEQEVQLGQHNPPGDDLTTSQAFMVSLMNPSAEGIIYLILSEKKPSLKYTLLDPKNYFRDIVEDARAVVLAGGTMSPMSDYSDYLFPYLKPERLVTHSFGHVIPPSNLAVMTLTTGPAGQRLEFTYERRQSRPMIMDVGESLVELCKIIPDGVVVFFPSYDYLKLVIEHFKQDRAGESTIYERIDAVKPVFWEAKDQPVADNLFQRYTSSINEGKGGILFSVVGGKLSEGINFSDQLGRAVIMIGLPFPNIQSAEWKAKTEHVQQIRLEQLAANPLLSKADQESQAKAAGREFYENACMRAVNQCVGRVIRHRNDFAAILFMDCRYQSPRIYTKLPGWIRGNGRFHLGEPSMLDVQRHLTSFFEGKKMRTRGTED